MPDANLALISVAGRYAGREAMRALESGLNVMLFSDNVPIETELDLKTFAHATDLLVMGPDCGTAIINGVPLAFANVVRRGEIGIVAASGTGLQEVSSIISNEGAGISQAIRHRRPRREEERRRHHVHRRAAGAGGRRRDEGHRARLEASRQVGARAHQRGRRRHRQACGPHIPGSETRWPERRSHSRGSGAQGRGALARERPPRGQRNARVPRRRHLGPHRRAGAGPD